MLECVLQAWHACVGCTHVLGGCLLRDMCVEVHACAVCMHHSSMHIFICTQPCPRVNAHNCVCTAHTRELLRAQCTCSPASACMHIHGCLCTLDTCVGCVHRCCAADLWRFMHAHTWGGVSVHSGGADTLHMDSKSQSGQVFPQKLLYFCSPPQGKHDRAGLG